MASEQHITLLRQGFKVWNLWRQRHPKIIPELKGSDLTGLKLFKVDLIGADLSEVDFSGTSLYQANLSGANLCKANLSTAILQEADLSGANLIEANLKDKKFPQTNLSGANLSGANLSGVKFYASTNLNKTNFSSSNLNGADLSGLNLRSSNFTGANLCKANLNATNLNAANLCKANLSEANLEYANLREAQIQEATIDEKWYLVWDIVNNGAEGRDLHGLDLSMADLEGANLSEADLRDADFTKAKLNRANLEKSNLINANLSEADMNMANLRMANLREANLSGADFSEANLGEANLKYAKLHQTQIQKAIIDPKWYLVWDVVNNGAEERELNEVDLSEANLSETNFKNVNLSSSDLSKSILHGANFSWADLSKVDFRGASLAGANFDWADFGEADLSEAEGFDSITCSGANFSGASFRQTNISSYSLNEFKKQGVSFNEADLSEAFIAMYAGATLSVLDKKEFFENLISWKNKKAFNESIKKSLSSSEKGFIPGILLYTDEDEKLSLYVREHFDAFDKLTGDWCTIYLLENPSPKWKKANLDWRKRIESGLNVSWFRSKPYDKSEAYDIARELNIESSSLPCLVLVSPANLSEKLVLPIREVSPEYFRKLFSTLEKLVKGVSSEKSGQREASSQVFDYLKLNFIKIVDFLEKHASKEENGGTKYILKGDSIFVSIEPVNIGNVNYNERVEGNYVQGDYTDQSRNLRVGNVGGDFKPIGSALMADSFRASGTVAESINIDQGMPEGEELQNRQDKKSSNKTSKGYEPRSISKVVGVVVILLALLSGLAAYIFFRLDLSRQPVPRLLQEQGTKE